MAERYQMQERDQVALTFTGAQVREVNGRYPSLAANRNGKLVEVHQPSLGLTWSDKVYYQVGTVLDDLTIYWSEEKKGSGIIGKCARVALNNNNTVVIMYEKSRHVHYHVGTLNTTKDSIKWNAECPVTVSRGRYPVVTLNDNGQVVVAYEGNLSYRTYYRTAQLQEQGNSIINWSDERRLFTVGVNELSLAVNQVGCIVAVGRGRGGNFHFRIGTVPPTGDGQNQAVEINWEYDFQMPLAYCHPCISIDDVGNFTLVYQGSYMRQLYYQVGRVENNRIEWKNDPRNYDMGCNPTVALYSNGKWVEEHETNSAHRGHKLFYRVGKIDGAGDAEVQPEQNED